MSPIWLFYKGDSVPVYFGEEKPAVNNVTTSTVHWTMDKEGKDLEQSSMSNNITIFRF